MVVSFFEGGEIMAVQISFCGYNGNTTVHTIREDFKKLEIVKNKVKEYRSKGGKGKFDDKETAEKSSLSAGGYGRCCCYGHAAV